MSDKVPIPLFIIVHDRLWCLKRAVKSFEEKISHPIKIIFHDVASTYPPCLQYLEEKKRQGYTVYRSNRNDHLTVMNSVKKYMNAHPECKYFILTDPDIELNNQHHDIVERYIHLSEYYKQKRVVGPMLKIDDLPDHYPYKSKVIKSHTRQFWGHKPVPTPVFKGRRSKMLRCKIDTTFQLCHRRFINIKFPREGVRTYAPYDARHLDWYIDPNNLTADQIYYSKKGSSVISHWGNGVHKHTKAKPKPAPKKPKPKPKPKEITLTKVARR